MGSKVLLADDSVTIQKVVGIIFANEDYELNIVGNGDAALQKARETVPDVMLVDALMPGKNGYEVCQEIRRDPALQHIALLLMTGAFDAVDEEQKRQSGADDFITKPFESQALLDVTARLIALSRDRAQSPPPQRPAAAPVAPQPVAPPVAAPAAPAVDDIWGGDFAAGLEQEVVTNVPEPFGAASTPAVAAAPTPVAAKTDDDLWGVFDMDAVDATAMAAAGAPSSAPSVSAGEDIFAFGGEEPAAVATAPAMDEFVLDEMAEEEQVVAGSPPAAGFDAFTEFDLEQPAAAPAPAPAMAVAGIPSEDDFSTISFDEPMATAAAPAAPQAAPPVAPQTVPPVSQPAAPAPAAVPEPAAAVAPAVSAVPAAGAPLDEEQAKRLLSQLSREVIEKIVWEVVPDLAESIIREEIRKIKEGIGR